MYLVFDIGATKMRLALSRDGQTFETPKIIPSPTDTAELIASFRAVARELVGNEVPSAVCGGLTRKHYGAKEEIAKLFSCPTCFENDAALAGLGEAVVGAGQNYKIVAYLTISTGVGGARIVGGKIDAKVSGFEPGKQIIDYQGERQTLEDQVSGRALEQHTGQSPKLVTDPAVWEQLAKILAYGLHNTILHWSPAVVVLGGSMILGRPSIDLNAVTANLKQISTVFPELPSLKPAALGDFGGLHGALHFLRQK